MGSAERKPDPAAGQFACVTLAWGEHETELRRYLRHRLGDDASADDLLQEVFLKAMKAGQGFCTLEQPRAWLFQVARNALVDGVRRGKRYDPLPQDLPDPASTAADSDLTPVDELAGCLGRSIAGLSTDDAAVLRACDLQGQTVQEFAQAHGLSLPAAKSRLLRARQRLRERLVRLCQVQFDDDGTVAGHVPRPAAGG